MAKQTYTTGQVLTAAQMTTLQANDYNWTVSAKTGNYTLVAADAGTRITMTSATATAITVNTGVFTAGDILEIINLGAGILTITAGTATVNTAGSLALGQYESGVLFFNSTGAAIFSDYYQASGTTSPLTTKGDLYGYSTTNARVPIGTDGQILTADSTAALGLKWASAAGGGGITLISTTTFTGSTLTLSSISGSYKNLYCEITGVYGDSTYQDVNVRFNSDSGTNYDYGKLGSQNSSADISNAASQTSFQIVSSGTNSGASDKSSAYLNIYNYAQTTVPIIFMGFGRGKQDANFKSLFINGQYRNSAAITSISFIASAGNFSAGTVKLYGVN
jgi:hypothetical protein